MRAFAWFLGVLVAAGLAAAAIAFPVFELTSRIAPWPFHRVYGRIAMLAAAAALVFWCRRFGVANGRGLGYGLPWRRFCAVAALFAAVGIVTASLGAAFLLVAGIRVVSDPASLASPAHLAHLALVAISSGLAVALIEETVMRGALHSVIARESGQMAALWLIAPLFAVLHFFAKTHVDSPDWSSGFHLLAGSFAPLGNLRAVLDSLLAWAVVSMVLSLTRILTGNIAVAMGLHAGWVVVLRLLQEATGSGTAHSAWVGSFDGLVGWWVLPWAAAISIVLWSTHGLWVPYAAGESGGDASPGDASPGGPPSGASSASLSSLSRGSSSSR
jgi:membrane protease YdiL (CAAX protease family)